MDAPPLPDTRGRTFQARSIERLQYAYFGNSGAEAVECAMKFARAATRRPGFFRSTVDSRRLDGALSFCGDEDGKGFGPFLPGCSTIPFGDIDRSKKNSRPKTSQGLSWERSRRRRRGEWSQSQWNDIQRLCRKYGTLLILDEIQRAIGARENFSRLSIGNRADLVCLSKALTTEWCLPP